MVWSMGHYAVVWFSAADEVFRARFTDRLGNPLGGPFDLGRRTEPIGPFQGLNFDVEPLGNGGFLMVNVDQADPGGFEIRRIGPAGVVAAEVELIAARGAPFFCRARPGPRERRESALGVAQLLRGQCRR